MWSWMKPGRWVPREEPAVCLQRTPAQTSACSHQTVRRLVYAFNRALSSTACNHSQLSITASTFTQSALHTRTRLVDLVPPVRSGPRSHSRQSPGGRSLTR